MIITTPSVELITETNLKKIELIGKVCTKKEHNITEDSAPKFVINRIKEGHTAILLHEYIYFDVGEIPLEAIRDLIIYNRYIHTDDTGSYIAMNYRVLLDMVLPIKRNIRRKKLVSDVKQLEDFINCLWDLTPEFNSLFPNFKINKLRNDFYKSNTKCYIDRVNKDIILKYSPELYFISLKFITDRGIANEIVRHGEISPMQQSTRWCDSKGSIEFINPFEDENVVKSLANTDCNLTSGEICMMDDFATQEAIYNELRDLKIPPQIARNSLPLGLKTEIVMTGSLEMWYGENIEETIFGLLIKENKGFLPQRTSKSAHPQIQTLANQAKEIIDTNFRKYYVN